ncbi:MAG: FKBP-type peptidyl-prolyl cis-trans isomerase [Anaerolineae bacterium]|nr:FKBP-type peptidyl-prolyl cis-trans isomerase [Anaerolineae bacterium]
MKKRLLLLVLLALLLPAAVFAQEAATEETVNIREVIADLEVSRGEDGSFILGNPEAPLTLIEFADWACPHCLDYRVVIEEFIANFVTTGDVNFEFRMFPTAGGARSVVAGHAAECADEQREGAFWEAHILLYEYVESGQYSDGLVDRLAADLELDADELEACMQDASQVDVDTRYGQSFGINGTPGVMIRSGNNDPIFIRIDDVTFNRGGAPLDILEAALTTPLEDMVDPQIALNEAFLSTNADEEGVETTESGLQYRVDVEGEGDEHPDDVVVMHYIGSFTDGTEFDNSRERDENPLVISLGNLFPGLTEGIQLMTAGSTYTFWIPPELAYGSAGAGNVIPPNSILVFEIDLISIGDPTVAANEAFFAENAEQEGVQTTESGLQYRMNVEGTGDAHPQASDMVVLHYEGFLTDGTKFDGSREGGVPAEFPVSGLIPGFSEGLMLMTVGSSYTFWIPPELGYGAEGIPGVIPPNSILVFEIELLGINE